MYGNFASAAQFYVFVGVSTMLFCVAMGVYYVYFHDRYFSDSRFSKYEFIFSIIIVLLWFIASCAWADNVNQFKMYTSVSRICNEVKPNMHCEATEQATYGGLNASLVMIFPFLVIYLTEFIQQCRNIFVYQLGIDISTPSLIECVCVLVILLRLLILTTLDVDFV
ncbi:unnamed protein product [Schistosoma rodhaini]|uniref:MARVEL domain-containing protein n=1 Tax=Schistosoma rodhaini TaxID=6188 RepID=A0AA85G077_9TREM|nr:unnamed protein product [Schistosoma rodhaini]